MHAKLKAPTERRRFGVVEPEGEEEESKEKAPRVIGPPLASLLPRSLQHRVVPLPCSDKKIADTWTPDRGLAAFPQPFRMMCLGQPNCGKSTLAKTVLMHADPPFDELYVIHADFDPDGEGTAEWDDADYTEMMGEIPPLEWWRELCSKDDPDEPPIRRLVVMDDLELSKMSTERQQAMMTLFRYISSHYGISLILCYQQMFSMPPAFRKMANIIVCWKPVARNEMGTIANRVGLTGDQFRDLFAQAARMFGPDDRHSLCFDETHNSPAKVRINLFEPVEV